jgi:putative GTP pyrophosphokinase
MQRIEFPSASISAAGTSLLEFNKVNDDIRLRESVVVHGSTIPAEAACEIQVRTILQHAYAQMAHGSVYKPNISLPHENERKVRRALAKGSALATMASNWAMVGTGRLGV